ncbi:hypothetical protein [Pseudomonas sp. BN411]|uniref:DUF6966 domain-containing protein n=1 Tax=Pseudomonas sp. BN411 TaxID=2567887 RepID=UPI002458D381|nr:hypothetical protein [Pseudomonas sp. BN411]MDH4563186.1 hypothetical protein [Pseudomonas sp. BN411]
MKGFNNIDCDLERLIELLRLGGEDDWAVALEEVRLDFHCDVKFASSRLLSMFGGMGSLNDIVLYSDGQPLIAENNELDLLRAKIYEVCKG